MLLLCSYFNMEQLKTHLDGIIFRCTLLMLWSNMTTPISTITLSVLKLIITTNLFHIIQLTIITVNIRERHNIVWIKWYFFFFLTPQYILVLQVHAIIWKKVQQRGPCAFRQAAVRAGHHPQTGDQFDAELRPSPHHPAEVRLTLR